MPRVILQRDQLRRLIQKRRRFGADRFDEVWDGVYVMSPEADNEHQLLGFELAAVLREAVGTLRGVTVYPPINITDREDRWRENYRVPDISVFLPGNPAEDRGSHWLGGPDFAIEILSPGDRSRKKFRFYAKVGVRELLILDRNPWRLELYRRDGTEWRLVGTSAPDESAAVSSDVLPLVFRLLPGEARPSVNITRTDTDQRWSI